MQEVKKAVVTNVGAGPVLGPAGDRTDQADLTDQVLAGAVPDAGGNDAGPGPGADMPQVPGLDVGGEAAPKAPPAADESAKVKSGVDKTDAEIAQLCARKVMDHLMCMLREMEHTEGLACEENAEALELLKLAQAALERRTKRLMVEG